MKTKNDLNNYFYIYVFSVLLGNASLWLYLKKVLVKVRIKEINMIKHMKPTIILFIPQIAAQVYTLLDRTMLGIIIPGKAEVGYYDQSQKLIKMLLAVVTSLAPVMLTRIANTFATGDKDKMNNYIYKSFNVIFILAFPIIFGVISVSKVFVPIFFGEGYNKVSILMNIISPIILFIGISSVTRNAIFTPNKKTKRIHYINYYWGNS